MGDGGTVDAHGGSVGPAQAACCVCRHWFYLLQKVLQAFPPCACACRHSILPKILDLSHHGGACIVRTTHKTNPAEYNNVL